MHPLQVMTVHKQKHAQQYIYIKIIFIIVILFFYKLINQFILKHFVVLVVFAALIATGCSKEEFTSNEAQTQEEQTVQKNAIELIQENGGVLIEAPHNDSYPEGMDAYYYYVTPDDAKPQIILLPGNSGGRPVEPGIICNKRAEYWDGSIICAETGDQCRIDNYGSGVVITFCKFDWFPL